MVWWCSGIVNFQDWAVTDIPGQGSLDLNTFLCKQPVSVVVYDFTAASASATAHRARWVAIGCKAHCMFAIRNRCSNSFNFLGALP